MPHLFVYGTLMAPTRLHEVTGKRFAAAPAVLKDFQKLDSHLGYPYIVPDKGSRVEGLLIRNVDPISLRKLDEYEGQLYTRKKVTVTFKGKVISCHTYRGNPKRLRPVST